MPVLSLQRLQYKQFNFLCCGKEERVLTPLCRRRIFPPITAGVLTPLRWHCSPPPTPFPWHKRRVFRPLCRRQLTNPCSDPRHPVGFPLCDPNPFSALPQFSRNVNFPLYDIIGRVYSIHYTAPRESAEDQPPCMDSPHTTKQTI
jgi:hypothetical protein